MFNSSPKDAINTYSKVNIETGVLAADPHQLIVLLFDGALKSLADADAAMKANNIAEKGRLITRVVLIIESGLRASLNKKVGGDLALNLDQLYGYLTNQLVLANAENDLTKLATVKTSLTELRDAWLKIAPNRAKQDPEAKVDAVGMADAVDALAPRKVSQIFA